MAKADPIKFSNNQINSSKLNPDSFFQTEITLAHDTGLVAELVASLVHEVTQPLAVINAYASGCIYRLKNNNFDKEQLLIVMDKINLNTHLLIEIIHRFSQKSC